MNTLNTIGAAPATALAQALFTLEILSDAASVPILNYLLENDEATLLDLIIATGLDSPVLEAQLEALMQAQVVHLQSDMYGNYYYVDQSRLAKVSAIAAQLVRR